MQLHMDNHSFSERVAYLTPPYAELLEQDVLADRPRARVHRKAG